MITLPKRLFRTIRKTWPRHAWHSCDPHTWSIMPLTRTRACMANRPPCHPKWCNKRTRFINNSKRCARVVKPWSISVTIRKNGYVCLFVCIAPVQRASSGALALIDILFCLSLCLSLLANSMCIMATVTTSLIASRKDQIGDK